MSVAALKQLSIQYLRGAVAPFSLTFEKAKKLTVVYGENAAGKSTICDALEFLGKGQVGSLENRGLGKTGRYWPSSGKKLSDVSVTLQTADGAVCKAMVLKGGDVVVQPPELRPRVEVLRKRQILALIEATPANRYEAIKRFIDVSGVEDSEAHLRTLIVKDLKSGRDQAVARIDENAKTIRDFWESAGKPKPDPFSWAESECKRDLTAVALEVAALTALQTAYTRLLEYPQLLKSKSDSLDAARKSNTAAEGQASTAAHSIAKDASEIVSVLEAARVYLKKVPSPAGCPVCESSEKVAKLSERIEERLGGFSALRTARAAMEAAAKALQQAESQFESCCENASRNLAEFEKRLAHSDLPDDLSKPSKIPSDISYLPSWLTSIAHVPPEWKKAENDRSEKKTFTETLRKALETWRTNTQAQKEIDALLPRLEKALEIAEEERRQFTDGILAGIAGEVGRLYEIVHPGEGLNKISLQLDSGKRASLDLGTIFGGQNTSPQAYFSDSHLDTLGLCIFVALSSLDGPENTTLVLDDVLASVDEPHVERVIEMLYSEAAKFRHTVITTHYRPWKEKYRWGWLKNGQCQFVELTKWTTQAGLTLIRSVPDVDRLRQLLAESSPDPQLVCAKAGVILEAALDFLTLQYGCQVARKLGGDYTLGDLLPAIDKGLRTALRVDVLATTGTGGKSYNTISLKPMLDELARIAQVRNVVGCHFNELSFALLDSDGLAFGQQVLKLIEALADEDAGWPRQGKSGEYWATAGETRKLYPYKKPT
jgi:energy-coupling factor transporter ATP-binding protein EcfA2